MPLEDVEQHVAAPLIVGGEIAIVLVGQPERDGTGLLQRRGRADSEKVVDLSDRAGERGRRNRPADTPAGDAVGLRQAVDRHRAIGHPINRRDRNVPVTVVGNVLVDLIRDRSRVPFAAERADRFELLSGEHLAGRVVRRIDDDGLRAGVERRGQLVGIERPVWLAQRDVSRRGARQNRIRPVVLVEGLEDDDFVARIDEGHHGGHHRLGRAAAHRDLLVGNHAESVAPLELASDRLAQRARAPRDRVLVDVGVDCRTRRVLDGGGRRKIRKSLRQVDAPMKLIEPGHLADDRLGELGGLLRSGELGHFHAAAAGASRRGSSSFSSLPTTSFSTERTLSL